MEKMKFAEELVREFLVFRGFTNTLQSFEKELATDIGKGFQVDKILDLIFSVYIPKFEAGKLIELLSFFRNCFSYSDPNLIDVISKLHQSILRYYVVYALKCGRKDAVLELFRDFGNELMRGDESWTSWFAVPYFQNPHLEPQFRVYFSDEWFRTLHLSVRNFLSEMLNGTRTPALLKIGSERDTVNRLKQEIKQLSLKLSQAQTLLEETEAQICLFRSSEAASVAPSMTYETHSSFNDHADDNRSNDVGQGFKENSVAGSSSDLHNEEDFPEVKTVFEDTFLGHTSPINCSRFSASGDNIASASVDGTVRIWTYDSSAPTSRNATIYCGAEIMSLEWDCKSDRLVFCSMLYLDRSFFWCSLVKYLPSNEDWASDLIVMSISLKLLIGTSDGGIKAWNVDAKRVVCDLNTSEAYPSILDLKCSPVEPIFVSAAASGRQGSGSSDSLGFASLTVWNMRTWKAMTVLPLGKDPPAITSLSFNHNGKLLAAAATDGLIHMFDMSSYQQVTGWPAHDCGISSILFGPDETSIFSLGTDGNIFEWSLHNQGKVLWSRNCSRFCNLENSSQWRHQMALDSEGRRLLVTSSSERAPIYQVRGRMSGMRSLAHKGSITTVDWHPHLPIFLTGSSDHSVRVSSISS